MRAVADASSLIHPAKVPRFWALMRKTFKEILIPEAVYKEVLKGSEIRSPDVTVIERAIEEGWINVRKVELKTPLPENLGGGEKEAIALMNKEKANWLLMDDKVASTTAKLMGLNVRPAVYLLIYWTRKGVTNASQALEMLDDMVKEGYRLGSQDYITIKRLVIGAHEKTKKNPSQPRPRIRHRAIPRS